MNTYNTDFNVWVHVAVLKLTRSINPFFLQHMLNSPVCYQQAQNLTHGVGNQDLGLTRMVRIVLPLAPIHEQEIIVTQVERALSITKSLSGASASISKRLDSLQEMVLNRAFRGELVPQDPNDEPASVLLERIRAERAASEGSTKKPRRSRKAAEPA